MTSGKMIDFNEKDALCERLNSLNKGYWLSLKSEIHYRGEEAWFWFLIDDPKHMRTILDLFLKESSQVVTAFPGTDFNMGIYMFQADEEILLESFSNDEIRSPDEIDYPLGKDPMMMNLKPRRDWWGV